MGARAIWKGTIRFDGIRLPVKMYSAVEDRTIRFHLLHDQDMVRLRQRLVDPATGETVEFANARRGFEIERDRVLPVTADELTSLEPEASRDIDVLQFVPPDEIDHRWYERPFYLGPDENDADYFALAKVLAKRNVEGVVRWTMRKKEYVGALHCRDKYLMLVTLRSAEELIRTSDLKMPTGRDLDERERKLAGQLVDALADDFRPADYRDEYRQRVRELIDVKRTGGEIEIREPEERPRRESLAEALEASLGSQR